MTKRERERERERKQKLLAATPGTTRPTSVSHRLGDIVRMAIVADERPSACFPVVCNPHDLHEITPTVRAIVYQTLQEAGIPCEALAFDPTVGGIGDRPFPFQDQNGKEKIGHPFVFQFEFLDRAWFVLDQTLRVLS